MESLACSVWTLMLQASHESGVESWMGGFFSPFEKFCNLEHFGFYIFGPEIFNLCNKMIRTICGLPAAPASPLTSSLLLLLKRSSFGCQVAQSHRPLRMTVLSPLDIQKRRPGKQHLGGIWEYIPGDWGNWTVPRTQGGGTMKSTPGSLLP
jgi:hypothetical protein